MFRRCIALTKDLVNKSSSRPKQSLLFIDSNVFENVAILICSLQVSNSSNESSNLDFNLSSALDINDT